MKQPRDSVVAPDILPKGDGFRWAGNVYAILALVLVAAVLLDWATGWPAYCWVRFKVAQLTYAYGTTIGVAALIAFIFRRFKLALAIILPGFFPIAWGILEREIGFEPACVLSVS